MPWCMTPSPMQTKDEVLSVIAVKFLLGSFPAKAVVPAPASTPIYSRLSVVGAVLDHLDHDSKRVLTSYLAIPV